MKWHWVMWTIYVPSVLATIIVWAIYFLKDGPANHTLFVWGTVLGGIWILSGIMLSVGFINSIDTSNPTSSRESGRRQCPRCGHMWITDSCNTCGWDGSPDS